MDVFKMIKNGKLRDFNYNISSWSSVDFGNAFKLFDDISNSSWLSDKWSDSLFDFDWKAPSNKSSWSFPDFNYKEPSWVLDVGNASKWTPNTNFTYMTSGIDTCEYRRSIIAQYLVGSVFFWLLLIGAVMGTVGNSVVILTVIRTKKFHTPTYIIIASLAMVDLMLAVVFFIFHSDVMQYVLICWDDASTKNVWYTVVGIFQFMLPLMSAMHIVLFAAVRYVILIYPFRSRLYVTKRKTTLMAVGAWVIPIIIVPAVDRLTKIDDNFENSLILIYWLLYYLVPLALLTIFHCGKLFKLKKQQKATSQHTSVPVLVSKKMNIITAVVVLGYLLLLLPGFIYVLLLKDNMSDEFSRKFWMSSLTLQVANSCVNPIIYSALSKTFRESAGNICPGSQTIN